VKDKSRPLIEVKSVSRSFARDNRTDILVIDDCSLSIYPDEFVALIGKTGSGKSTLLRIISGLISASSGDLLYKGTSYCGPLPGLSMVFQDFALLPWLTVLGNVELALESFDFTKSVKREKALSAIDMVGLDGFESAYPKELSGGMCQRVGLARALVVDPTIILMDEPFSALDTLTSENLRADLMDLWKSEANNLSSILMVTHSIEEAVLMADRILIFNDDPGSVKAEIHNNMLHPRSENDENFSLLVDEIYKCITSTTKNAHLYRGKYKIVDLHYRIPNVSVSELSGLLEALNGPEYANKVDLAEFADDMQLDVDDLFQIIEILEILRFLYLDQRNIVLTPIGRAFADADILSRKSIFAEQLIAHIPFIKHIKNVLEKNNKAVDESVFIEDLQGTLTEDSAKEALVAAIDWGRYAELFAYNVNTGLLSLENP
jgi:NitT/TauT family transport system ATP-binding protein